jgi:hypothetical protein
MDRPSPRRRKCVHSSTAWGRRPRAGPSVSYGLGGKPSDDAARNPLVLRHVSHAFESAGAHGVLGRRTHRLKLPFSTACQNDSQHAEHFVHKPMS